MKASNTLDLDSAKDSLPSHLRKFAVDQFYERYTPIDQAVWRYILRQLKHFLSTHAHSSYNQGLTDTGISIERIPKIADIDKKMQKFGWRAVPVSGFIPPAAFMEMQSRGFLPIASDMRSIDHIFYTPAPDIVHEAAGHAPIIANPEYSNYLKDHADVARGAIMSQEDIALYEAVRDLSDIKENPDSTAEEIAASETHLQKVVESMTFVSEAAELTRMNWWTAEYGLIGEGDDLKIFGAGLLSSVGESQAILDEKVEKVPLSLDCIKYPYNITEPQPQLFVAKDFKHLKEVLLELAGTFAYKKGGLNALDKTIQAETINSFVLSSQIQISGRLASYKADENDKPIYLSLQGPCQLCFDFKELDGHGVDFHHSGYGTALGLIRGSDLPLEDWSDEQLTEHGLILNKASKLEFASGVVVSGVLSTVLRRNKKIILLTFDQCTVTYKDETLFQPEWGVYDMAIGTSELSLFGGPADRQGFGDSGIPVKVIPLRKYSEEEKKRHSLYEKIREFRENFKNGKEIQPLLEELKGHPKEWLPRLEVLEVLQKKKAEIETHKSLHSELLKMANDHPELRQQILRGLEVIDDLPLIFE